MQIISVTFSERIFLIKLYFRFLKCHRTDGFSGNYIFISMIISMVFRFQSSN